MIIGLPDPVKVCTDVENKKDSIRPQPQYELAIQNSYKTVILTVESGRNKPYAYRSKAYRRNDTATIEVDELELTILILQGKNINYEKSSSKQTSSFFYVPTESNSRKCFLPSPHRGNIGYYD